MHSTSTILTCTKEDPLNTKRLQVTTSVATQRDTGLKKKTWPWLRQSRKTKVKIGRKLLRLFQAELTFNACIDGKKYSIQALSKVLGLRKKTD
jgi:hypothetical protein